VDIRHTDAVFVRDFQVSLVIRKPVKYRMLYNDLVAAVWRKMQMNKLSSSKCMSQFNNCTFVFLMTAVLGSVSAVSLAALAQTGGNYDLSHTVIASGGGSNSVGGNYIVDGTAGQGMAGVFSTGGNYGNNSGFWAFDVFALNASTVTVSGRVTTADGAGIRGAIMSLAGNAGLIRTVQTEAFGYYHFEDLPSGQTYILKISSKRFTFAEPTRVLVVDDGVTGSDFVAEPH